MRNALGALGRLLIAAGVLLLLFVVYVLWGTGILEASHQSSLRRQFDRELHIRTTTTTSPGRTGSTTLPTSGGQPAAPGSVPAEGQPVGILQIPKIGLDKVIVEGTGESDLQLGPGHYAGTPLPGQPGNSAIAGHRTTYGAPFYNLNELGPGDSIYVTTTQGRFDYQVQQAPSTVAPTDTTVVAATTSNELTLTTCNPRFSATQRLIVHAILTGQAVNPPPHQSSSSPSSSSSSSAHDDVTQLAGEQGSFGAALAWGAGFLALAITIWMLGRDRKLRWVIYSAGVLPLLVVLFFFFENLSPLLPASF